ncbi:MAG: ferredoxin reductase family protein [Solirubrobacteraceae bacterium]|nr:ferredoxin reductase family protein [Patulibacter sp.]
MPAVPPHPSVPPEADAPPGAAAGAGAGIDLVRVPEAAAGPLGAESVEPAGSQLPPRSARRYPRTTWFVVMLVFVVGPLVLAELGDWSGRGRGFVAELGSSLGIVALGILALELVLTARLRILASLGADTAVRLHRRLANVLLSLVTAHVLIAVAAQPSRIGLFQVFGQPWRAQAAIGSVVALLLIGVTSTWRRRLRLTYSRWRLLHLLLAVLAMVLAAVHTIGWDRYLMTGVGVGALAGLTVSALLASGTLRIRRPMALRRLPYVIDEVVAERGSTTTLVLRAEGHSGQLFSPGQFAWLKLDDTRFGLAEHPFSYSSSAESPDRPSFTVRAYEGFSAAAAALLPGTRVLIDGPHGAFRFARRGSGIALFATGIGITPSMSILRTAADRRDGRRFLLFYGSREEEGITFREELDRLAGLIDLTVVHTLSTVPPDSVWTGERGRITADLLERHLPQDLRDWQFFVCGSGPAVDAVIDATTAVGIPHEHVHAERFVAV